MPTEAEREVLNCTHIQSHELLKQAFGLRWDDELVGTDFLLPQHALEQEPNIGYNETALATLQLSIMLKKCKS